MSSTVPKRSPLHVADILHTVLDCLSEPAMRFGTVSGVVRVRTPRKEGKRALFALAQTCRMLSEPSLDCLWRGLDSLQPLLRCFLDKGDVEDIEDIEDMHSPSPAEWDTIHRYSHRVRELKVSVGKGDLFLLECSAFENLLPNLKVLSWGPRLDRSLIYIQPLLSPKLVFFSLKVTVATYEPRELMSFLKTLPSRYPDLKAVDFDIEPGHGEAAITPALSKAACAFKRIDCFSVRNSILDDDALRHLVMSSQFIQLLLTIEQSQVERLHLRPSDKPFPNAKRVKLRGLDLGSITHLLRCEGQPFSVAELYLAIAPTSELSLSFFTALASNPRLVSLHSVTLNRTTSHVWPTEEEGFKVDDYILSRDTLQPLIFFRNLVELHINLKNPISLDDAELVDLARHWPMLRFLHLASGGGLSTKYTTLRGLLLLNLTCPQLERIGLCLDATAVPQSGEGLDFCSSTVKTLNFTCSPITEPQSVAAFLLQHFPSVTSVAYHSSTTYDEKWYEVRRWLKKSMGTTPPNAQ